MSVPTIADWDDAYANTAHIPGGEGFPARLATASAAFRADFDESRFQTLAHGEHSREVVELFLPEGAPRGLLVFVHGGYWMKFSPADYSHLATGGLWRGWAVAMVGYRLAPHARIAEIAAAVARGIGVAAAAVGGSIVLTGHSAGGHLVARMVCEDTALAPAVRERLARVVPISGLFDLRPLLRTAMNETLRLDLAEARSESPALREVLAGTPPVHVWVGAAERPEFVRQSALLANVWTGLGVETRLTLDRGRHHFDVIDGLVLPDSPLMTALIGPAA